MIKTFREALNKGITPSQRRNLALKEVGKQVIAGKPSYHSASGSMVCTLLHALEEAGEPYVLFANPGRGYQIEAAKKATDEEWKAKLTPPPQSPETNLMGDLLGRWREGQFETTADEAAQTALDNQAVGLDVAPIIEAWLKSLSSRERTRV